jgi:hypothetical protein
MMDGITRRGRRRGRPHSEGAKGGRGGADEGALGLVQVASLVKKNEVWKQLRKWLAMSPTSAPRKSEGRTKSPHKWVHDCGLRSGFDQGVKRVMIRLNPGRIITKKINCVVTNERAAEEGGAKCCLGDCGETRIGGAFEVGPNCRACQASRVHAASGV